MLMTQRGLAEHEKYTRSEADTDHGLVLLVLFRMIGVLDGVRILLNTCHRKYVMISLTWISQANTSGFLSSSISERS
jgi:hypothetical protein